MADASTLPARIPGSGRSASLQQQWGPYGPIKRDVRRYRGRHHRTYVWDAPHSSVRHLAENAPHRMANGRNRRAPKPRYMEIDPWAIDDPPVLAGSAFDLERIRFAVTAVRLRQPSLGADLFRGEMEDNPETQKPGKELCHRSTRVRGVGILRRKQEDVHLRRLIEIPLRIAAMEPATHGAWEFSALQQPGTLPTPRLGDNSLVRYRHLGWAKIAGYETGRFP